MKTKGANNGTKSKYFILCKYFKIYMFYSSEQGLELARKVIILKNTILLLYLIYINWSNNELNLI